MGGRAGHSVINAPIAVIIRLMTPLFDGVLRARPQGARLKCLQERHLPSSIPHVSSPNTKPHIMSFMVQRSYRVPFLPASKWAN